MVGIPSSLIAHLKRSAHLSSELCSDSELLVRFIRWQDSTAFELLFWRHGPMVWNVCKRILGSTSDAEDAFQASFVVLIHKAKTIVRGTAIAGWLHRVAWRTSLNIRMTRARQLIREHPLDANTERPLEDNPVRYAELRETSDILDRELASLPEKFRLPLILCDLESWSHEAAATQLNCALGTLNSRLVRAREKLRLRLKQCGVVFSGFGAISLMPSVVSAVVHRLAFVPPIRIQELANSTIRSLSFTISQKSVNVMALCAICVVGAVMTAFGMGSGTFSAKTLNGELPSTQVPAQAENQDPLSRFVDPDGVPLPRGSLARVGSNRLRHIGEVTGLKYSPDGKWLASISTASTDATARLWDAISGKEQLSVPILVARYHDIAMFLVRALGFSADSKQFFVIETSSFRAFDIHSGKELFKHQIDNPTRKYQGITGAAVSPDGKVFVLVRAEVKIANEKGVIEICDINTGKVLQTIEQAIDSLFVPVEFSADGRYFIVNSRPMSGNEIPLPIIETATGKVVAQLVGKEALRSIQFVPGTELIAGITDPSANMPRSRNAVAFYDLKSGKEQRKIELDIGAFSLVFSPDGKTLVVGNGSRTSSQIIDVAVGKEVARIPSTPTISTLAFSPSGRLLAGASLGSGAISVWEMSTHDYHRVAAVPASFKGVHFVGDSNTLAIPGRGHPLIDWHTGIILDRLPVQATDRASWWQPVLSNDRQWLAEFQGNDRSIQLLNARTGEEVHRFTGHKDFVENISFSSDNSRLATGSYDKTIRVWDLKKRVEIAQFTAPELTGRERISLSDNGRILATRINYGHTGGTILLIWDVDTKKQLARVDTATRFSTPVAISPDGRWVAGGGGSPGPGAPPALPGQATPPAPSGKPENEETSISIWESSSGREVRSLPGHRFGKDFPGASCSFSPDSRWLVTGDATGRLRVWEVCSGQEIRSFKGHQLDVTASFSPDSRLLVAASEDAPCLIWNIMDTSAKAIRLSAGEIQAAWTELGSKDAKKAFESLCRLVANPDLSVEAIRKNLKPAVPIQEAELKKLLRDLKSDEFAEREKATAELSKIADQVEQTLRKELAASDSPEHRTRLSQILKTLTIPSLKRSQQIRSLSVLEFIASSDAKSLIEELCEGTKEDFLTKAAIETRDRLRKR
jgi:RNA polymerase sigma factor (sigma-70 family)